jgi:hypothetical protein
MRILQIECYVTVWFAIYSSIGKKLETREREREQKEGKC